jgi:hypothetical protein
MVIKYLGVFYLFSQLSIKLNCPLVKWRLLEQYGAQNIKLHHTYSMNVCRLSASISLARQ